MSCVPSCIACAFRGEYYVTKEAGIAEADKSRYVILKELAMVVLSWLYL